MCVCVCLLQQHEFSVIWIGIFYILGSILIDIRVARCAYTVWHRCKLICRGKPICRTHSYRERGRAQGLKYLWICRNRHLRTLTSLHTFPPALTAESPVLQGPNANSFHDCTNYMHKRNATKQSKPPGFVGVEVHMAVRSQWNRLLWDTTLPLVILLTWNNATSL